MTARPRLKLLRGQSADPPVVRESKLDLKELSIN